MKLVRLYISQNNRRWHEDIPYGDHLERSAELQMDGATVYHASLLTGKTASSSQRIGAKLRKRAY